MPPDSFLTSRPLLLSRRNVYLPTVPDWLRAPKGPVYALGRLTPTPRYVFLTPPKPLTKLDEQLREHYQNNSPSTSFGPVQEAVCELIANHQPRIETALEFGSGVGRNLEHLWSAHGILGQGIEINPKTVSDSVYDSIECGDESLLNLFRTWSMDAVFTCSVLCHIDEALSIVEDLERIARSLVVLAETNATPAWNYVPHPYAEWGYADNGRRILSAPGNNCLYHLWTKEMPA